MLYLLISAWLNLSLIQWQSDTTSLVLVEYNETMSLDGLLNPLNYQVTDGSNNYKIYKIGIVNKIGDVTPKDTSVVLLICERLPYRKDFWVIVQNVRDKAGNLIGEHNKAWFYFNGYTPHRLQTPAVKLKN